MGFFLLKISGGQHRLVFYDMCAHSVPAVAQMTKIIPRA